MDQPIQEEKDKLRQGKMRYVRGSTIPRKVPAGRVLAHNHVWHTTTTRCGLNGFCAWTQNASDKLESCVCGWSGLPHYRVKGIKKK